MATLYVDLDGVFADFDTGARKVLNTDNSYKWEFVHGAKAFWQKLDAHPDFFGSLPLMPGAGDMWEAIEHLNPVVLTALPKKDADKVDRSKRKWVSSKLHYKTKVITCETTDKPKYCQPGDILVDDRAINRDAWIAAGGTFLLHTSPTGTLNALQALGII